MRAAIPYKYAIFSLLAITVSSNLNCTQRRAIIIMNTFQITYNLTSVYPDIEGQLSSKHSTLLSAISRAFAKTYPLHSPTHFVVAKQPLILAKGKQWQIEMAMEQAITLLVSAADENEKMNIWTNANEQIVLQNNGKIINIESEQQLTALASRAIGLAVEDMSLTKVKGGFVYFYMPSICSLQSKQTQCSILVALFMAALTINGLVEQYSAQDLICKLKTLQEFRDNKMAQSYLGLYRNRELLISGLSTRQVRIEKKYKLVLLSLSCFNQQIQLDVGDESQSAQQVDVLIGQLAADKISWIDLTKRLAQITSIKQQDSSINTLIKTAQTQLNIQTAFYTHQYCVFIVQSYRYAEIISQLSQLIHSQLQSQPTEQLYSKSTAAASRQKMQSILFSSMPSTGLSIIDPSNAMWL